MSKAKGPLVGKNEQPPSGNTEANSTKAMATRTRTDDVPSHKRLTRFDYNHTGFGTAAHPPKVVTRGCANICCDQSTPNRAPKWRFQVIPGRCRCHTRVIPRRRSCSRTDARTWSNGD